MRTIVSKFGGSSTASAATLGRVLDIVRASPARRCVVLSAPGADESHPEKVTALLEMCWERRHDDRAFAQIAAKVADRFSEIATGLGLPDMKKEVTASLGCAAQISRDALLSRGEYLCARLFSRYSGIPMADATALVRFDGDGRLDEARTLSAFETLLEGHERVVVPGFYGADAAGQIRVFPRNGSDISGALAAAGLGAGLYENWTDVPGLMTADPDLVPGARLIRQVSYRQMRSLARAGARVLHPACLDPVALAGIPTRLRCTWTPDSFGTLVDDACGEAAPCIAGRREAALPRFFGMEAHPLSSISVFGVPHARVAEAAAALNPASVEGTGDGVRLYVSRGRYEEGVRLLHDVLIENE